MDPVALTTFLAPCLGFLLDAGRDAADRAAGALGEKLWEHARGIWARLGPAFDERPAAREAAGDVAARPDDERARTALTWQLEKVLEGDPALAAELATLFDGARRAGVVASGDRAVAVGGDIADSTVITGDSNLIGRER